MFDAADADAVIIDRQRGRHRTLPLMVGVRVVERPWGRRHGRPYLRCLLITLLLCPERFLQVLQALDVVDNAA